ncbi:hypothetical protein PHMEG_00034886 [Phytophthora megakarya]|uniref:Tyr recombinase domain-containing protein n=1 Tax=Phytophthora megakarya TaxID=4795 RepID=A0A225URI0_9STRA|nr:hypothetical protein PHMEG_00034886 [Phytophthora megakarya]
MYSLTLDLAPGTLLMVDYGLIPFCPGRKHRYLQLLGTVQDVLVHLQSQALAKGSHHNGLPGVKTKATHNGYPAHVTKTQNNSFTTQSGRQRNAASTILSKIGHISWLHRRHCGFSVGLHPGHQLALQGMQRMSAPPSRKLPMSPHLLRQLRSHCNFDLTHDRVLWAAAVMGYLYMLRKSEYLSDRGVTKPYEIQLRDVTFRAARGDRATTKAEAISVSIHFRGSKSDQEGVGATTTIERSRSNWLCPVRAVWELVEHGRRIGLGPRALLCSTSRFTSLSASDMTRAVKAAVSAAGENPADYGTHSMRSGGATALFRAGIDRLAIKHFGRWKSDAYEQYAKIDNVTLSGIAAAMTRDDSQLLHGEGSLSSKWGHSTPHPRLE